MPVTKPRRRRSPRAANSAAATSVARPNPTTNSIGPPPSFRSSSIRILLRSVQRAPAGPVTAISVSRARGPCVDRGVADERSDPDLLARLRRGDGDAFDAVYAAHREGLFRFLARLCGRVELAEDLFQETWMRLARHAHALRDGTNLGAWLYTVARNLHRSH